MAKITSKEQSLKERLGSDLKYPIQNTFEPISGVDLLLQDIQRLLLTIPGERPFRPDFGCYLRKQVWENIDTAAIEGAASIRDSIERFEPRVTLIDVSSSVNRNTGLITFNIQFQINNDDSVLNLVFPYRTNTQLSFS
jgi:phage baseplate assembly protein W